MLYFLVFILTLFWQFFYSTFFILLCDRQSVVISKVHYESIIFLEFIQIFYDDPH
jgi:hypothetical protein